MRRPPLFRQGLCFGCDLLRQARLAIDEVHAERGEIRERVVALSTMLDEVAGRNAMSASRATFVTWRLMKQKNLPSVDCNTG